MQISIVTLNYNGSNETIRLLESLKNQTDSNFKLIIVDNASKEADFTNLQTNLQKSIPIPTRQVDYPQVKVIKNSQNLGFSGGCNVGILQALRVFNHSTHLEQENDSDWIVLLNNDTWVENDFIERLRAVLSVKNPSALQQRDQAGSGQIGVIGVPLVEDDKIAYCGKIEWLKPTLKHVYSIKNLVLRDNENNLPNTKYLILNARYYAIGGAVAIHKNVFEKIGLLDEKYFLYFEDADFSIRAKRAGFDILIADNCMIYHTVSTTTKKLGSPLLLRYHYRNALYFNLKNGPWYIKLLIWPWSWIIIIKQLGKIIIKQNIDQSKAVLAGVMGFYKYSMGHIKK